MWLSASVQYGAGLRKKSGEKNATANAVSIRKKIIEIKKYLNKYI